MRLVVALEDEIRKRGKRARELGIVMGVEASFGSAGIVLCERPGTIERAGFVNQRNDCFGADRIKFLFLQHARNQLASIAMTIFHRVDQRQRDFSFFQVAEDRLAELFRGRREIQQIIDKLKPKASEPPVIRERLFLFPFKTTEYGAQSRTTAKPACRYLCRQLTRT